MIDIDKERLITPAEAGEIARCSAKSIVERMRTGKLEWVSWGRSKRTSREALSRAMTSSDDCDDEQYDLAGQHRRAALAQKQLREEFGI